MADNVFDFSNRPPARNSHKNLVDLIKASNGAVERAAWGAPSTVARDPLDDVLDAVAGITPGERPPTTVHGVVTQAVRQQRQAPQQEQATVAPPGRLTREQINAMSAKELEVRQAEIDAEQLALYEAQRAAPGYQTAAELEEEIVDDSFGGSYEWDADAFDDSPIEEATEAEANGDLPEFGSWEVT